MAERLDRRRLPTLLDAHRDRLEACTRCADRIPGVRPIRSGGVRPRLMIVGQAPGITEAEGGVPFAGRAGRTLFRWLARAGIAEADARRHVYIAALTRCYPGRAAGGRGDRIPSPAEQAACAPWLAHELALIAPRLVIPIGRLSIARFLGEAPLDRVVGRVHDVEHAGAVRRVLPLPHPSGASSWFHVPANARLLDRALQVLAAEWCAIVPARDRGAA